MKEPAKSRKNLAKNVRQYRRKKNLTQEKTAEIAEVEYKYYQSIEGKNPPNITLQTLEKIAKALDAKPSDLIKDTEEDS